MYEGHSLITVRELNTKKRRFELKTPASALFEPVRIGLIGAGRIGTAHAATLARHVPGARLIAIADPRPGAAEAIATPLGVRAATDPANLFSDPEIEAVVTAASSTSHTKLILAAIAAGKRCRVVLRRVCGRVR
jgi:predicted dehydrogenase